MIGARVQYHGSIDDAWGRYVVAQQVGSEDGPRYNLATYSGDMALYRVRATSVTPVPVGPKHVVAGAQLRAQIVRGEFGRNFKPGHWLPYIHDYFENRLPGEVARLLDANRPVEAEAALLNAERFVGCIGHKEFQERMAALVVAGDDESWMPVRR